MAQTMRQEQMIIRSPQNGRAARDISGPVNEGHKDPLSWKDHLYLVKQHLRAQLGAIDTHPSVAGERGE